MVPDPEISLELNEEATKELLLISTKLLELLPDPSLSPDERLERLARVVQNRVPQVENLQSANAKVHRLKRRLDELVPDEGGNYINKIDSLVCILDQNCSDKDAGSVVEKLEFLGDPRIGVNPAE